MWVRFVGVVGVVNVDAVVVRSETCAPESNPPRLAFAVENVIFVRTERRNNPAWERDGVVDKAEEVRRILAALNHNADKNG